MSTEKSSSRGRAGGGGRGKRTGTVEREQKVKKERESGDFEEILNKHYLGFIPKEIKNSLQSGAINIVDYFKPEKSNDVNLIFDSLTFLAKDNVISDKTAIAMLEGLLSLFKHCVVFNNVSEKDFNSITRALQQKLKMKNLTPQDIKAKHEKIVEAIAENLKIFLKELLTLYIFPIVRKNKFSEASSETFSKITWTVHLMLSCLAEEKSYHKNIVPQKKELIKAFKLELLECTEILSAAYYSVALAGDQNPLYLETLTALHVKEEQYVKYLKEKLFVLSDAMDKTIFPQQQKDFFQKTHLYFISLLSLNLWLCQQNNDYTKNPEEFINLVENIILYECRTEVVKYLNENRDDSRCYLLLRELLLCSSTFSYGAILRMICYHFILEPESISLWHQNNRLVILDKIHNFFDIQTDRTDRQCLKKLNLIADVNADFDSESIIILREKIIDKIKKDLATENCTIIDYLSRFEGFNLLLKASPSFTETIKNIINSSAILEDKLNSIIEVLIQYLNSDVQSNKELSGKIRQLISLVQHPDEAHKDDSDSENEIQKNINTTSSASSSGVSIDDNIGQYPEPQSVPKKKKRKVQKVCENILDKLEKKYPQKKIATQKPRELQYQGLVFRRVHNADSKQDLYFAVTDEAYVILVELVGSKRKVDDKVLYPRMAKNENEQGLKSLGKDEYPDKKFTHKAKFLGVGDYDIRCLVMPIAQTEFKDAGLLVGEIVTDHNLKPIKIKKNFGQPQNFFKGTPKLSEKKAQVEISEGSSVSTESTVEYPVNASDNQPTKQTFGGF